MLSLPILGIIVAEALQLRLSGTDGILLFIRPENLWLVQLLGPFFLAAAIAAYYTAPAHVAAPTPWGDYLRRHLPTLTLIGIIALALDCASITSVSKISRPTRKSVGMQLPAYCAPVCRWNILVSFIPVGAVP